MEARGRGEAGFSMIEVIVGMLLAAVGLLGVAGSIDGFRTFANQSDARAAATAVAQQEMERMRSLGWEALQMTASPGTSTDPKDPRSRVTGGDPPHYSPGPGAQSQPLVIASNPAVAKVSHLPTAWQAQNHRGKVYRFVTWADDASCLILTCPGTEDYKRATVVVTFESEDTPSAPITLSTAVVDPDKEPVSGIVNGVVNPLTAPESSPGGSSILGATMQTWFAYDTPISQSARQAPSASHATRDTLATPDMLGSSLPPAADDGSAPTLYKYSTDLAGTYPGGLAMQRSGSGCNGSTKTQRHRFATPVTGLATVLTGNAAASFYTQTMGGVPATIKLCVRVYAMTPEVLLVPATYTQIGNDVTYELTAWPTSPQRIAFPFRFMNTGSIATVLATQRVVFEVLVHSTSSADVVLLYDHPDYPSAFQLETAAST